MYTYSEQLFVSSCVAKLDIRLSVADMIARYREIETEKEIEIERHPILST